MDLIEKMDGYGKGAWIAAMVLGFILFWPVGLALLFFLIWSNRMGCKGRHWRRNSRTMGGSIRSSGNSAFDEYKAATISRLEDEQTAFKDFLESLRRSKDKAEFDQFMKDLKSGKGDTGPTPEPAT